VAAAAIVQLRGEQIRYAGVWEPGVFPGSPSKLPDGRSWVEQLVIWRRQIETLLEEFAAGDTRVFTLDTDLAEARGAFAPLTRVIEQLALQRGSVARW
jgi:hypothetical protein